MEDSTVVETRHLSDAAAFVEGRRIQDACEDSCSICLEAFCDSDPSSVTKCNHEFHLQCILEWCQRSSQCPMCWQPISFKDPSSQELFDAVEQERNIRSNQAQNTAIFHHPTLGEFELQNLPVGASDEELEERIIQHLAAASAMRRAHHFSRTEELQGRLGAYGNPQFVVFSALPNAPSLGPVSASSTQGGENEPAAADVTASASEFLSVVGNSHLQVPGIVPLAADHVAMSPARSSSVSTPARAGLFGGRGSSSQFTSDNQDRSGPSDLQSFSESLKSRLNAVSTRYKDSIVKSTRGWKERFSRNSLVTDFGSEVRREVNSRIATVSRMMERLDTRDNRRASAVCAIRNPEHSSVEQSSGGRISENQVNVNSESNNMSASC